MFFINFPNVLPFVINEGSSETSLNCNFTGDEVVEPAVKMELDGDPSGADSLANGALSGTQHQQRFKHKKKKPKHR